MRRVKVVAEVVMDAYWRLAEDDGWAIASHLAMSTLTSMFPFLIFVTALAGFVGSTDLSEAGREPVVRRLATPGRGADRARDPHGADDGARWTP